MHVTVPTESDMERLGARVAGCLQGGEILFLKGELGAGKTTFTRGLLRGLGYNGTVKSPTYTLVENYELTTLSVYHFDLYRLNDPEELEDMGIRDYCQPGSTCLIEWPERGAGVLTGADLTVTITTAGQSREVNIAAGTESGSAILAALAARGNANLR